MNKFVHNSVVAVACGLATIGMTVLLWAALLHLKYNGTWIPLVTWLVGAATLAVFYFRFWKPQLEILNRMQADNNSRSAR